MQREDLKKTELPDMVLCPLQKKEISAVECCNLGLVIDKLAPKSMTKFDIENTPNCEKICKDCKYHDV